MSEDETGRRSGFIVPKRSTEHGFTLIEMIVALAIFSLAALALLRLEATTLTGTARLADVATAQIVARNLAVNILSDPAPPAIGADSGRVTNGGVDWIWNRETIRTDDVRIIRVDLNVTDANGRALTRLSLARPTQ